MIAVAILNFVVARVGQRWAKPAIYASLAVLLIVGLGVAKCAYDRSVIDRHDAKEEAKTERAARKASDDATAADNARRGDFSASQGAIERKVDDAADKSPAGPGTRAYFDCLRRQRTGGHKAAC